MQTALEIPTPEWALPLLEPARYKAAHGGRGGGKSHLFAENVVERCLGPNKLTKPANKGDAPVRSPVRIVCIREVQNSIKDSVKQLIVDKINAMGVADRFEVVDTEIRGPYDSLIIFKGMHAYNAANIKSLEGYDIAWVEEAQTFSEVSLRMLRPTIRKEYADGTVSELWFTWNPRHETDAVDHFFRGNSPLAKGWNRPTDAIIIECNWPDNPWFTSVLRQEKDDDYASDPDMAEHVWGGGYERVTVGAYFAKLIANLERIGRIGAFPYDPVLGKVYTSWDLGVDDYTAIWFFQVYWIEEVPRVRIIDYFQFNGEGAQTIIPAAMPEYTRDVQDRVTQMMEIGRDIGFKYQRHFFPHDLKNREWGNAATERIKTVVTLGVPASTIAKGVATDPEERINATRVLLPMCEFNNSGRVMLGISCLRRFQRKIHQQLGFYMGPLHDETSHGADAFGEFAINCGIKMPEPVAPDPVVKAAATTQGFQIPPNRTRPRGQLRL